jgi:RNA polymerase sigma factor (sigma-70 family)
VNPGRFRLPFTRAKKAPRERGLSRRNVERENRTCGSIDVSKLASQLRLRCDGDHKNALLIDDGTLAEDLLSEVFLDVWRQAASFEARSSGSTWLLAIARYKALSARRRRTDAELDDATVGTVPDIADDPELTLQKKDRAEALRQSLHRLSPERTRRIRRPADPAMNSPLCHIRAERRRPISYRLPEGFLHCKHHRHQLRRQPDKKSNLNRSIDENRCLPSVERFGNTTVRQRFPHVTSGTNRP